MNSEKKYQKDFVDATAYLAEELGWTYEDAELALSTVFDNHESALYANDVQGDGKMQRLGFLALAKEYVRNRKQQTLREQVEIRYRLTVMERVNSKAPQRR